MKSHITERFRKAYANLPDQAQNQVRSAYNLFQQNPHHPSLRFKRVHPTRPIYSVRISRDYRALGTQDKDEIIWFWVGSHADYEKLLSQL